MLVPVPFVPVDSAGVLWAAEVEHHCKVRLCGSGMGGLMWLFRHVGVGMAVRFFGVLFEVSPQNHPAVFPFD